MLNKKLLSQEPEPPGAALFLPGAGVGTAQKIGGYATLPRPKGAVNRKNDKLFSFRCYAS